MTAGRLDPDESHERYVATVVEEGERFGVLAWELGSGRTPVAGGLDVPVPWVPEWTVRQLVAHLGAVHRWATAILRAGTVEAPEPSSRFRPPDDDLAGWYALGLTELVATLRTVDPDAPAWHMSPAASRRAREWGRRQAHELVVHRLDLEAAAGVAHAPLDPQLAADGVDELLGIMLPRWQHTPPLVGARAVVAVTATDVGRSWRVEVADGTVRTGRAAPGEPADATLTGSAEMLLRRVWGRPADVTVSGDPAAEALLRGR
ncbi:maleylpyruvate isomerase family mycothiol-dependent enzyme [Modestobacter sp. URMC 112]